MQQVQRFLDDLGVNPAPKPAAYGTAVTVARRKGIAEDGTPLASKRHRLRASKVPGESKAERRMRRRELAR